MTEVAGQKSHSVPLAGSAEQDRHMARKNQLIDVATHLFSQYGLEGTTTKDIARAAGVSPGLLYHYYTSKEDLLVDVIKRFGDNQPDVDFVERYRALPIHAALEGVFNDMLSFANNKRDELWLLLRAAVRFPAVEKAVKSFNKSGALSLEIFLLDRISRGELREFDAKQFSRGICHSIIMLGMAAPSLGEGFNTKELVEFMLYGILAR